MKTENEIKAVAVKEFVNMMVGARKSGFVESSNVNLQQIHRVAQTHISDNYGVDSKSLNEEWGEEVYTLCRHDSETWGTDFYPPIGELCQMLWNTKPLEYIKILPVGFDTEGFLVYQDLSDDDELFGRGYPHIRGDKTPKYMPINKANGGITNG